MCVLSFIEFVGEAKLANVSVVDGDSGGTFSGYMGTEFVHDGSLVSKVEVPDCGVFVRVRWYHNVVHDMSERARGRSEISSVSELNELVEDIIVTIFPDEINETITRDGRYDIHLVNRDIHFLVDVDYEKLFGQEPMIRIVSIVKGVVTDVVGRIEIDD